MKNNMIDMLFLFGGSVKFAICFLNNQARQILLKDTFSAGYCAPIFYDSKRNNGDLFFFKKSVSSLLEDLFLRKSNSAREKKCLGQSVEYITKAERKFVYMELPSAFLQFKEIAQS